MMRGRLHVLVLVGVLAAASTPLLADARSEAKALVSFGIEVANRGLWREAIYRWRRATEVDPTYAPAFNNLAVGYEQEGELDKAQEAYEKAMTLAPTDHNIRQNYELFKEINERASAPPKEQP
jgi:Tfp pilus assembly protein PilF